ncbi:MAG: MobF family relaxase [Solirubrobacteraceae bacterium]
MRRMSAGSGYQYLLHSVAAGDGSRALSTPLTRYYEEAGTPPGFWLGSGVRALGGGRIEAGTPVTEEQLALLIGMGRDPITGEQLGRAYPTYKSPEERREAGAQHAVAGFDLTFSTPKSVSVLWGLADAPIQERVVAAHHAAVADVIDLFEREVAVTRTGFSDGDGAVAQVEVAGVAAVGYDHYDSRAADPQLHTHVVVSNKVMTLLDGRWRSLDGRPVHASVTALSAHYNALLADRLTRELGVGWELRDRGAERNDQWEITGIDEDLIGEFSSRSREIDLEKDRLVVAYREAHGRLPSKKKIVELRAQATLATRPPKEIRSLADLTAEWRERAARLTRDAPVAGAPSLFGHAGEGLALEDVPVAAIEAISAHVVRAVSSSRATWNHWNLMSEASRQTMSLRFVSTEVREAVTDMIVEAAERRSIPLTPPELALSPVTFRRADGSSVFRPRHSITYSSLTVLDAEARLLARAGETDAPRIGQRLNERIARFTKGLTAEQRAAVAGIATSGRRLDLLVGPAGTGKTTTMRALRRVWQAAYGRGSIVGLAPSATAAQALADDLGVACENTAKWLWEHDHSNQAYRLRKGQLVILDEASLAGTITLDRITAVACDAGAKVLLVGDGHQLSAVDAGGAFELLVTSRDDAPRLNQIHRFRHDWESDATVRLRRGDADVIATYERHDRIKEGHTEPMLDAAYDGWRADTRRGAASILVAETADVVRALNTRARADRITVEGAPHGREINLAGEERASVGDLVITRRNDRRIRACCGGWVRNGDRWRITGVRRDGSVVARRASADRWGSSVILPSSYVSQHLDLGYAITAHRAQGITVDTAHVVVSASTTRENLYVAMTRGRESNVAYVALDQPDESHQAPEDVDVTARSVLYGVLQHTGVGLSAHQTMKLEQETCGGIARSAAELETIAADAQRHRFAGLLGRSGLTKAQHDAVIGSTAFGPLTAALRRAEANHHDLSRLLPRVVAQHGLDDADDIAAVLTHRINKTAIAPPRGVRNAKPRLIAGLIPEPLGPMSDENRQAIDERKALIEARAHALASSALASTEPWTSGIIAPPSNDQDLKSWQEAVATVAAYRDRYGVTSDRPVGSRADSDAQRADRIRAIQALRRAETLVKVLDDPGNASAMPTRISSECAVMSC